MQHDDAIHDLLKKYFELMYTCNTSAFDTVFHSNAQLQTVGNNGYSCLTAAVYKDILSKRQSPASTSAHRSDQILMIDQSSATSALAKVSVVINGVTFCDYLSLLKIDKTWLVVAKVYCLA